jgi:hypothetical protein
VPRARSQALGTETLWREQRVQLSAQKKPAVQTYCAEREQSRLSAQASTHGTEDLCRELQKRALGTAATSRRNERPSWPFARPSNVPRAHFWLSAQSTCAECLPQALGKELKKN